MPEIDVKEAVSIAKAFVSEVLAEEKPYNIGLEEVEFDEGTGTWLVTIGFSRPWDKGPFSTLSDTALRRDYRIVTVSDHLRTAVSMKRPEHVALHA
ncbi:MAG TPA: hypothetical protein VIN06_09155 [Devosia sp.]